MVGPTPITIAHAPSNRKGISWGKSPNPDRHDDFPYESGVSPRSIASQLSSSPSASSRAVNPEWVTPRRMTNAGMEPRRVSTAMDVGVARRPSMVRLSDVVGPLGLTCVWNPDDPLVDVVFVHGMGGGSYKTWRKNNKVDQFWPSEWLPRDPNFKTARIHTFGYNANWSEDSDAALDMVGAGKALHSAMISSPHLNKGNKTPIIMVGHDMGGIVIKQGLLEFRREVAEGVDHHHSGLAHRIRSLMFMATPHLGADNPNQLSKIIQASGIKCSPSKLKGTHLVNEKINMNFAHYAKDYTIYCFFETKPCDGLGIIVSSENAVIGSPDQIMVALGADHRNMCKFEHEQDPNYLEILNHMSREIDDLIEFDSGPAAEDSHPLSVYLACEESQDEMLDNFLEAKVEGSCEWIEKRTKFQEWKRTGRENNVSIYWLRAPPGAGKSYMSSHVTKYLSVQQNVAYYYFVNGIIHYRTVASLVRSLALQMAEQDDVVKQALQQMQRENIHLDEDDEKGLWRKLFINRIFSLQLGRPQFWVIDALDECSDGLKLFGLLKIMRPSYPIRIFITSRPLGEFINQFTQLPRSISHVPEEIVPEDTRGDIRLMLEANRGYMPVDDEEDSNKLISKIVSSSKGSFLWANVVMNEVQSVFDKESVEALLDQVPQQMEEHYERILEQTMAQTAQRPLVRAILTWAVCSSRHLSLEEFRMALKLDINKDIPSSNMARAIESLCGQLLRVDRTGDVHHVHLIHTTVREFLLSKTGSTAAYAIKREDGHLRLAKTCLNFLLSPKFTQAVAREAVARTKRHERVNSNLHVDDKSRLRPVDKAAPFAEYAASAFSYHLVNGPWDNPEIFTLLDRFLSSQHVLSWIEYVALVSDSLDHVKEAGANLKRLLERRSKKHANVGPQFRRIASWSIDLIRIVAKFGRNIREAPAQIKELVPALCPRSSAVYEQFGRKTASELRVIGISDEIWADAISYIEHTDSYPTCISCNDRFVAIGYRSKTVHIFDATTCEELTSFLHDGDEPPRHLVFDNTGNKLLTAGREYATLWNLEGFLEDVNSSAYALWSKRVMDTCVGFYFSDSDDRIVAATKSNYLCIWPTDDEAEEQPFEVTLVVRGGRRGSRPQNSNMQEPTSVSFSPDGATVAMAYNGRPVMTWNVEDGQFLGELGGSADVAVGGGIGGAGQAGTGGGMLVVEKVLFNPNPDIRLMAVTYREGQMSLFEYDTRFQMKKTVDAEPFALSSTPDGRTLATGDARGSIQLWDFETLTLLYHIDYHSHGVRDLIFSRDGLRLFDIRETHSVVWEPAALIRETDEEERSNSGTSLMVRAGGVPEYDDPVEITALAVHPSEDVAFVGKDDGNVYTYNLNTGKALTKLMELEPETPVTHLVFNGDDWLACADSNGKVMVARLDKASSTVEEATLLDHKLGPSIRQLIFSKSGQHLLVSSDRRMQQWKLVSVDATEEFGPDDGVVVADQDGATTATTATTATPTESWSWLGESSTPSHGCWKYFASSLDKEHFMLIDKGIENFVPREQLLLEPRKHHHTDTTDLNPAASPTHIRSVVADDELGYVVVEYECAKATTQLVILQRTSSPAPSSIAPGATGSGYSFGALPNRGPLPGMFASPSMSASSLVAPPSSHPAGQRHHSHPSLGSTLAVPGRQHQPRSLAPPGGAGGGLDGAAGDAAPADADTYRVLAHLRSTQIKTFLGIHDGKAVYLGPHLWVRTVDLHHLLPKAYLRKHFFVPHEYIGGNHRVQAVVGNRGEVVFPRRGELVVVWNGIRAFDFAGDDHEAPDF